MPRCRDCIDDYIGRCEDLNQDALCPVCQRGPYTSAQLTSVKRRRARQNPLMPGQNSEESKIVLNKIDLVASTKLRALSRKLEALREQDPTAKALVFSQFTSFLGGYWKWRH
jgi:DNA repair protein RAD5